MDDTNAAGHEPAYITLTDAAKLMTGRGGRRPNVETLRRWANARQGCKPLGNQGPTIFLRVVRLNGYCMTTPDWVREFEKGRVSIGMRATSPPHQPIGTVEGEQFHVPNRTRQASIRRAMRELREG